MTASIPANSTAIRCPLCRRELLAGEWYAGVNYCRALAIVDAVERYPARTTWELSQLAGVPYSITSKGLLKARDLGVVEVASSEDRGDGSVRHRYRPAPDPRGPWARMAYAHDVATRRVKEPANRR